MSLRGCPLLIIDRRICRFVSDLQCALEAAGADVMAATSVAAALRRLEQFTYAACLIGPVGDPPELCRTLIGELGGIPVLAYGGGHGDWISKQPLEEDVPSLVASVKEAVRATR